jgi:hypothetical protein
MCDLHIAEVRTWTLGIDLVAHTQANSIRVVLPLSSFSEIRNAGVLTFCPAGSCVQIDMGTVQVQATGRVLL